jgi:hypothetical protein
VFGPFNSVIHKDVPRKLTGDEWTSQQGMLETIRGGHDVVILGYGASGAGKTSFLVAMTGGKSKDATQDSKGVFSYILRNISQGLNISQFTVYIHQAMNQEIYDQSATAIGDCGDENNCNINSTDPVVYKLDGGTNADGSEMYALSDGTIEKLEQFLEERVTQPAFRDTWATVNNKNSSRTHCIVRVEFGEKYGRILLGDLAGYENRFDCRLSRMPGFNQAKYMAMYQENAYWRDKGGQDQSIWQIEEVRQRRIKKNGPFKMPTEDELKTKQIEDAPKGTPVGTAAGTAASGTVAGTGLRGGADDHTVWGLARDPGHFAFNKMQRDDPGMITIDKQDKETIKNIENIVAEYNDVYSANKTTDADLLKSVWTKVNDFYKFDEKTNINENPMNTTQLDVFSKIPVDVLFDADNAEIGSLLAAEMEVLPASIDGESDQILAPRESTMQSDADKKFDAYLYNDPPAESKVTVSKDDRSRLKVAFSAQSKFGDIVHRPGQLYGGVVPNPATFWAKLIENQARVKKYVTVTQPSQTGLIALKHHLKSNELLFTQIKNVYISWTKWFLAVTDYDTKPFKMTNATLTNEFPSHFNNDGSLISGKNARWSSISKSLRLAKATGATYVPEYNGTIEFFKLLEYVRSEIGKLIGKLTPEEQKPLREMLPQSLSEFLDTQQNEQIDIAKILATWFSYDNIKHIASAPKGEFQSITKLNHEGQSSKDEADPSNKNGLKSTDTKVVYTYTDKKTNQVTQIQGREILTFFDVNKDKFNTEAGITYYPRGLYFLFRTLIDEPDIIVTAEDKKAPQFNNDITATLFDLTFKTFYGISISNLQPNNDPMVPFMQFNTAARYAMLKYLDLWRLKGEMLAKNVVVMQHCLDRDVEAKYIIRTLNELTDYIQTNIFAKTGVNYPPIHVPCLGQMLRSVRYKNKEALIKQKIDKEVTLKWLGVDALRGDVVFCLAAVVNIADVKEEQQTTLVKYVDVSKVKDAVYRNDTNALLGALEDLVGWRSRVEVELNTKIMIPGKTNASLADRPMSAAIGRLNKTIVTKLMAYAWAGGESWGGKKEWDVYVGKDNALTAEQVMMEPLRAAVNAVREAVIAVDPTIQVVQCPDEKLKAIDTSDKFEDTLNAFKADWKAWFDFENKLLLTDGALSNASDGVKDAIAKINKKDLQDAAMKLCSYIDNDNASTALGVLEFMDKMAKFNKTDTVCHVEGATANAEFRIDHKKNKTSTGV